MIRRISLMVIIMNIVKRLKETVKRGFKETKIPVFKKKYVTNVKEIRI